MERRQFKILLWFSCLLYTYRLRNYVDAHKREFKHAINNVRRLKRMFKTR